MALPTIPKFTVSRIQHRRGNMIDLPQPLSLGEFGYADDENRLFIGGNPDTVTPMVRIYPSQSVLAQSTLDNITVFNVPVNYDVDTALAAISGIAMIPAITSSSFYKSGTFMYLSFTDAQIGSGFRGAVEAAIDGTSGVSILEVGLSAAITNNVILAASHDEANGISYSINRIAGVPTANTNLNVEIYTEVSAPTVLDFLGDTYILPPAASLTTIIGPSYSSTVIGSIKTIYSAFAYNTGSYYTATGELNTTACPTSVSFNDNIIDDVTGSMTGGLYLATDLSGGNIVFKYRNTTPVSIILKLQNTAWPIT